MQNLDSGFWILDCLVQNPNSRVQVLLSTKTKVQVLNHPKTRIQSPVSTDKADRNQDTYEGDLCQYYIDHAKFMLQYWNSTKIGVSLCNVQFGSNTVVSVIMMLRCPWSLVMLDDRAPILFYSIHNLGRSSGHHR